MKTVAEQLSAQVREGDLYQKLDSNRVRCYACGHCCPIPAGFAGVCKVRYNRGGKLYVPYGYVSALHADPIEKKPFLPCPAGNPRASASACWVATCIAATARTGLLRRRCAISDLSLDFTAITPRGSSGKPRARPAPPGLVSTYNEPLITSEWAVAVFREATRRRAGHRIRLQRQCHAGGARIPAAVGGSLQSRPEEFRRPPLSPTGRTHRSDSSDSIRRIARNGLLAGNRDAGGSRLQRFGRRN